MAARNPSRLFSLFLFSLFHCFLPNTSFCNGKETENSNIKGMFVFGSSLVDNGNNNFLQNSATADYFPYGIDFPLGTTGRWTNGKNVIDLLGDQFKLSDFIPRFMDPTTKGNRTLLGVNFASGASGILDETGSGAHVISLNQQIKNFENVTLPELESQMGSNNNESLSNYLFVVGTGGNDYTNTYFGKKSPINISVEAFTDNLTATLSHQLERLYNLGARKFVLMTVYPLGCYPGSIHKRLLRKGCVQNLNQAAQLFNTNLKSLVDNIGPQRPGSSHVVVSTYNIILDILQNPDSKGFSDTRNPCCEVPSLRTGISCKRGGTTCANRSTHVFFDGLHPTEALNAVLAAKAFASESKDEVYPFNVSRLAQI